jgi:hypothetical protein
MYRQNIIFLVVLFGVLFSLQTHASVFPNDAKTVYLEVAGNVTSQTILTKPSNSYSLLYLTTLTNTNEVNARIRLYCGASTILDVSKAQVNTNIERFTTQLCDSDLKLTTGNMNGTDRTSVRIVYLAYDLTTVPTNMVVLASVSFPSEPLLNSMASNSPDILPVYATMTAGDLLIILGIFTLVVLMLLEMLWRKNKFS